VSYRFSLFIVAAAVVIEGAACFISFPQHSQTVLYIALYILESHSLQISSQTYVLLGYILFDNDTAFADHNTAFVQIQDEGFP
jgi:hypothetical protein